MNAKHIEAIKKCLRWFIFVLLNFVLLTLKRPHMIAVQCINVTTKKEDQQKRSNNKRTKIEPKEKFLLLL
jgi:hypothetical protein